MNQEAKDPLHVYDLKNYFNAVDEITTAHSPMHVKSFIATDSDKVQQPVPHALAATVPLNDVGTLF